MKEHRRFTSHIAPEYLLLGMLAIAPSHGYELHQQIERDLRYVWRLSLSQVYNLLKRLEKQGLIRGEILEQEERPDRKRFQLTPEGKRHFQTWFDTPVGASVRAVRIAFLSKLYLGLRLPNTDLPGLMDDQHSAIQIGLSRIEEQFNEVHSSNPIIEQSLRLRIKQLNSLLTWLAECKNTLILE